MYDSYYRLSQIPFGLSPDVRFCFRHRSYERARAYMHYALHRGEGFVVVTGRPGTGKTTLIQDLLKDLGSRDSLIARIDNTQLESDDLLRLVTYSFGVKTRGLDKATLIHGLRDFLLGRVATQGKAILIVDEAQNLSGRALEELRLVTNLQHGARPLVQIFLVGQEGLRDLIRDPSLEQLHQRVVAACHLEPLGLAETRAYIQHRLLLAGWSGDPEIKADALRLIFGASGGVPRLINKVCDRVLLHGSLEERHSITAEDAQVVIQEFREELLDRFDGEDEDVTQSELAGAEPGLIDDLVFEPPVPPPARIQHPEAVLSSGETAASGNAHPAGKAGSRDQIPPQALGHGGTLTPDGEDEPVTSGASAGPDPSSPESAPSAALPAATVVAAPPRDDVAENAGEPTRSAGAGHPIATLGSQPGAGATPVEYGVAGSPANLALDSSTAPVGAGNLQAGESAGRKVDQARGSAWAFAVAATVLFAMVGLVYLLHNHAPESLSERISSLGKTLPVEIRALADRVVNPVRDDWAAPGTSPIESLEQSGMLQITRLASSADGNTGRAAGEQPFASRAESPSPLD